MVATPDYSFVIPVYNERETLHELYRRLAAVMERLDGPAEVVLVDDGSSDGSREIMRELARGDGRVRIVALSRNFGHQIALTAGLDHARGNAAVILDADLQDPPEVALELAARWREGYDVVYAIRQGRPGESWAKRRTATLFYRTLAGLSDHEVQPEVGDFRLVDRRVIDAVAGMPERHRYLRGMVGWVGFDQTGVTYVREPRFAGTSKYPWGKMVRLAQDAVLSFSSAPLRIVLKLGFAMSVLTFLIGVFGLVVKISGLYAVPGWASIIVVVAFVGSAQLTVLGMLGEYVARIYDEVKRRPLYLVSETVGFESADVGPEIGQAARG